MGNLAQLIAQGFPKVRTSVELRKKGMGKPSHFPVPSLGILPPFSSFSFFPFLSPTYINKIFRVAPQQRGLPQKNEKRKNIGLSLELQGRPGPPSWLALCN